MNEIRKVLDKADAIISDIESMQSLPADGGAWYPTWKEIDAAVPGLMTKTAALAVAKFAIDLYRSRGGQVGGSDEREALDDMLADARNELDMTRAALGIEYEPHQSLHERTLERVRELIARQPGAQPTHGPVVAFRFHPNDGVTLPSEWHDGSPNCVADAIAKLPGYTIELAYSHPATVPAEVMEAINDIEQYGGWVERERSGLNIRIRLVRDFLKSIDGAK